MTKWKMVPIWPTPKMYAAGGNKVDRPNPYDNDIADNVYDAMLLAAPKYEPTDEQVEAGARAIGKISPPYIGTEGIGLHQKMCRHFARAVLMTLEG